MDDAASRPSATHASANRSIDWPGTFVPPKVAYQAGSHLLVDFWDAERLSDAHGIGDILNAAATAAGATILHTHTHRFGIGGGVSGVVVLAESHITIHTWPEWKFAAIDLFMCGNCDPHRAIPVLRQFFRPGRLRVSEHRRGTLP